MKQLCAPLFLALCILQTLLATPVQAEFATFSASNLPLAPIQLAQEAIDFIVIRTRSEHSTSKSSSASIGVSYGTSGFNVSASASKSKGQGDGADLVHTNTTVSAGQAIRLSSGGDTTLAGATLTAPKVSADIGGNLTVQSLQDQSSYHSNSASTGGSVTVGSAPSASASLSKTRVDSDFQSVGTQSGIRAGDGGFQVNVKGDTTLVGGAITSTQAAIDNNKNSFTTGGTLTTTDLQNKAEFSAQSVGVSVGTSGGSAGIGSMGSNASSTTTAAISGIAGNKDARTGDAESGVKNGFDKDKVTQDVQAQVQITQQFGSQASKAVGDYAQTQMNKALSLQAQAAQTSDPAQRDALLQQATDMQNQWGDNGSLRLALHTVIGGLIGGVGGAAGAAAGTLSAPAVADALQNAGIEGPLAQALTALASTAAGAAVGGPDGACRAGGHVLIGGLSGGAGGAAGAGLSSVAAPHVEAFLVANGVPNDAAKAITQLSALGAGTAVGGAAGGAAGFNEASNNAVVAIPLLVEGIVAGGALAARACLTSPACLNALRLGGVALVAKVAALVDPADLVKIPGFGSSVPLPPMGPAITPADAQRVYGPPPLQNAEELRAWLGQALQGYPADEAQNWAQDLIRTLPVAEQQHYSDLIVQQVHHICTDKNCISPNSGGPWTPEFQKMFDKAGLSMQDEFNKVWVAGHQGPHPQEYHREIFDRLDAATLGKTGSAYTQAFQSELRALGVEISTAGSKLNQLVTKQ